MYIKQVIIEGFKSYKDQTRTEPFSNKINAIVGPNGAGKSNFFQAIRFVLDADARPLRQEDRQKLLHEGAGHAVLSAYVEIVLDNSDGRIQVEKDEIRLRRTIGLKKDQYQLNKKNCGKNEISDILESAGFSKANPYYVVQQGKITALSTMEDGERLSLLKEIGGSKVYEDRRTESLKILQDAEGRKRQIAELVSDMEGKLKQLDAEKEELAKYQAVDKERRSLEYAIYNKDISDTRTKLEQIENQRNDEADKAGKALEARKAANANLKRLTKEQSSLETRQKAAQDLLSGTIEQRRELTTRIAELECEIQDIKDKSKQDENDQVKCKKALSVLEKEIAKVEKARKEAENAYKQKKSQAEAIGAKTDALNARIAALTSKQGDAQSFANIEERDKYYNKKLEELAKDKQLQTKQIVDLKREAEDKQSEMQASRDKIAELKKSVTEKQRELLSCDRQEAEALSKRNTAQNKWRDVLQSIDELETNKKALTEDVRRLERKVQPMGAPHQRALQKARETSRARNIPLHGTILENIKCMPQLYTAVEVAAGGAMFHMVVNTDRDASTLINGIEQDPEAGRVTFLPLDKLMDENIKYPDQFGDDAKPLASYLKYSKGLQKAIQHVFGKWVVCRDSDVASKVIATTNAFNCVTIHGDKHEKKGKISGGWRDADKNMLQANADLVKARAELEKVTKEQQAHDERQAAIENEKNDCQNEEEMVKLRKKLARDRQKACQKDIEQESSQLQLLEDQLAQKNAARQSKEQILVKLDDDIRLNQQKLASRDMGNLSPAEIQEKKDLQAQLNRQKSEQMVADRDAAKAEAHLEKFNEHLNTDLRHQEATLQRQLQDEASDTSEASLEVKQDEFEKLRESAKEIQERESGAQAEVEKLGQAIQHCINEAESCREAQKETERSTEEETTAANQLIQKRALLLSKKTELEKKIRDLGSLPSEAFQKFQNHTAAELKNLLGKAQNALKKYGHVNKKALDQYLNFTEQREELVKRHDETVRGKQKIQQLIQTLDLRKDEAIERTFKGVAKNFREVFAELAPGGRGELVMQKAANQPAPSEQAEDDSQPPPLYERYSGVKVKVSFGGGETMSLKQLSGGQKTLVALALIFSIQRLDPAPFYLFDEIDAALDPAYRTTVAKMLAKQANDAHNPSQFVITTFHPQVIHETDRVYGVTHRARISTIDTISKSDALQFLSTEEKGQNDEDEDE